MIPGEDKGKNRMKNSRMIARSQIQGFDERKFQFVGSN
jgi:hypothetical protein